MLYWTIMEHPLNSSMEKAEVPDDSANNENTEESGWTSYFQDFSNGIMEPSYCSSLLGGSSSLVSDAASCAAWKFSHRNYHVGDSPNLISGKLRFKKTRTKQISEEDDPLEDTASSPVNSPKIADLNPTELISRKIDDDQLDGSKGKEFKSEHYPKVQTDECGININGNNNIGKCTELKKRGLCLVPLSMLVNYYG